MYACGERGGGAAGPRASRSNAHSQAQHAASRALALVAPPSVGHRGARPRPARQRARKHAHKRVPHAASCAHRLAVAGLLACKHARTHAQHAAEHAASRARALAALAAFVAAASVVGVTAPPIAAAPIAAAPVAAATVAFAADPIAAAPIAATPIATAPTPCASSVTRVTTTSRVPCVDSTTLSGVGSPGAICASEISAEPRWSFLPTWLGLGTWLVGGESEVGQSASTSRSKSGRAGFVVVQLKFRPRVRARVRATE